MKRLIVVIGVLLLTVSAEAGLEVRPFTVGVGPDGVIGYGYRVRLVSGRLDPASPVSQHVTLLSHSGLRSFTSARVEPAPGRSGRLQSSAA